MREFAFVMILFAIFVSSCSSSGPKLPDAAYQQAFDKWKSGLVESRKQNWLPLAGLLWLEPGENTFGSDAKNVIVFPKGPAFAGAFTLQDKDVSLRLASGVKATAGGKPFSGGKLISDASDNPTKVEIGSLDFHVIVRGQRIGIRLRDSESEVVRKYAGPQFYPLDMKYRVTADWIPSDGKRTIDVPTVLDDVETHVVPGTVVFNIKGQQVRLTAVSGNADQRLFFVFKDPTSQSDTYPSGRFLYAGPVKDGKVEIDFNRAYNPPCSLTPYATCPLAPKENLLAVPIPAGEMYDHTKGHH